MSLIFYFFSAPKDSVHPSDELKWQPHSPTTLYHSRLPLSGICIKIKKVFIRRGRYLPINRFKITLIIVEIFMRIDIRCSMPIKIRYLTIFRDLDFTKKSYLYLHISVVGYPFFIEQKANSKTTVTKALLNLKHLLFIS